MKKLNTLVVLLLFAASALHAQVEYSSGGSANAFTLTYPANITTITSGLSFTFKANHTITGPATLNINGLGAVSIKKEVSQNLAANDIKSGQIVITVYDGTNFQMITIPGAPSGGPPTGSAGGDLSGTYPNPTVAKLQTRNVSSLAPAANQVLGYNSGSFQWEPMDADAKKLQTRNVSSLAPAANQVLGYNSGSLQWEPMDADAKKLQGRSLVSTLPANGQVITWNNGLLQWEPQTISGTLSGGTTNYIPKWASANSLTSTSKIYDDGTNVGIGTTTPQAGLDVRGNISTNGGLTNNSLLWTPNGNERWILHSGISGVNGYGTIAIASNNAEATGQTLGNLIFGQIISGKSGTNPGVKAGISAITEGAGGAIGGFGAAITFSTKANNAANTFDERMRIDNTGNVGIGTTAPASKLEVAGTIHSTSGGIKFPDNTVQTTAASTGAGNWVYLGEVQLGADAATIDFSGISAYKYLKIFIKAANSVVANADIRIQFNGDVSTNYSWTLSGGGAQANVSSGWAGTVHGANTPEFWSLSEFTIYNESSQPKTSLGNYIMQLPAVTSSMGVFNTVWNNTSDQISSIKLFSSSGSNIKANSLLRVWGMN